MWRLGLLMCLGVLATPATADCKLSHQACEKVCAVKYLTDEAGEMGCQSRCVAERTACEAKEGVEAAGAATKSATESVKSFFKGLTEE